MDKNSLYLFIHPKENLGHNQLMKKLTSKNYYQMQNNEDYTEPNMYGEIYLGNQDSVGYNSDAELYDWEVENYETKARGCWTIQKL